jgi:hypothetical protein
VIDVRGPYRNDAIATRKAPPASLECWLRDGDKNRWIRAIYVKVIFTLAAIGMLFNVSPPATVLVALLGVVWVVSSFWKRNGMKVDLEVRGGRLHVRAGARELEATLDEIAEVRLDTKASSRNVTVARVDGVNSALGMAGHNIELDVSRIELVLTAEDDDEEQPPFVLSDEFINSTLCTESIRSIRLFLRAHGWKPKDERGE